MDVLIKTSIAFIAFCLIASSVYVFNDYYDIEEDRKHPKKMSRPLATGAVSRDSAFMIMATLLTIGCLISYLLHPSLFYLVLFYCILNVAYTLKLKHIAIIDLCVIAAGFVIRLYIGSVSSGIPLSMWIVIMTFLLALFIALAKRRDDVLIYLESGNKVRKIIDGYNIEFLNTAMMMIASVTIVAYIMYTVSPDVVSKMRTDKLYMTVIFVVLGFMRYLQITLVERRSGSPTQIVLNDRFLQFSMIGWIMTFLVLIYH